MNSTDVIHALKHYADPEKAEFSKRFFKTGKGQYGYGDVFIGMTLPEIRSEVKIFKGLALKEV